VIAGYGPFPFGLSVVACALQLGSPWIRGVAQLGSAPALGAGGRGFKSRLPDQSDQGFAPKVHQDDTSVDDVSAARDESLACESIAHSRRSRRIDAEGLGEVDRAL
jgi:hypothetical protein